MARQPRAKPWQPYLLRVRLKLSATLFDDNFAGPSLPPVNQTVSRFLVSGSGKMYPFTDITARIRFVGDGVVAGSGCPTSEGGSIVIETAIL